MNKSLHLLLTVFAIVISFLSFNIFRMIFIYSFLVKEITAKMNKTKECKIKI